VSARTGEGLAELCAALVSWLVPDPPLSGAAVPFSVELCDGIMEAQRFVANGDAAAAQRILIALRECEE